jgi:hypothetical protein
VPALLSRIIGLLFLLPFALAIAILAASEWGGEVVTLETYDPRGTMFSTSLWIVDLYGEEWLRASDPEASWVRRLRETPNVVLIRDGVRKGYLAVIVEDFSGRINDGMREKYGFADQLTGLLRDPEQVLAIRLEEP